MDLVYEIERVRRVAAHLINEARHVMIFLWCWWADNAIIMVTFTPVLATLCRAAPGIVQCEV